MLLAGVYGWVVVYVMIAVMMLLSIAGTLLAPEPEIRTGPGTARLTFQAGLPARERTFATLLVAAGWIAAFLMIASFVIASFTQVPPPKGGAFVSEQGPWIVVSHGAAACRRRVDSCFFATGASPPRSSKAQPTNPPRPGSPARSSAPSSIR